MPSPQDLTGAVPGCSQEFCHVLSTFAFGVMILGKKEEILFAGEWLYRVTGLEPKELKTLPQFESRLRYPMEEETRRKLVYGQTTTALVQFQAKDDYIRLYLQSFEDPRGCVILLVPNAISTHTEDLPTWDLIEDHSVNLYRTVIDSMKEGIVLQTANGSIVEANSSAAEILGLSSDQLMGRSSLDPRWSTVSENGEPLAGEDHPAMQVLRSGEPVYDFVMGINRSSGERAWILINSQPMKDDDGGVILAVTTFTDITSRLDQQKHLEKITLEARAASQAKSAFLANISHEIRTPLNAVLGFSQLLQNSLTDPTQKEYLQSIREGGQSLLALIDDVLDISKLEVGKIKLVNEPVDLVTLIRESKEIFDWKIKSQDTDVLLEFQEDLDRLFLLDEGRMRQILVNIIGNAVKFTPKGEIRLILEGEKNPDSWDLWIRVKDTGVGIKKDQIERVFEAFHQINPSEYEKNDGTGLGLSLTKGIVELMGGEIHLESELGRGTEVSILIPRVREARDETLVPSEGGNSKDLLEGRILVVDDVSSNRLIVKGLLRDSKKLFVEEAKDGEEGLAKIIGGGFDLVFLDIKMPKMGGDQVVKLVRDHPEFADLPIYALTASTGKDSLSEEFTGFLGKPMNFDDFFKVVSLHLSRGTKGGEERAVAPQPLPSEPVNPDALQELLSYQKKNLSEVKASGDFDRIKDFARKLRSLAEQFDWKALGVYAQQLLTATESFDIKTIRELLEDLPRWSDRWRYE